MKRFALSAVTSALLAVGWMPVSHAVQILRWERLPLAVLLIVNQERVVFIDRNVRVGVPAAVGERLRVQSAGGAIYLRANEPIESTRLQLQDADTGALILLDITASAGKGDQTPLEPVRIVEGDSPSKRSTSASELDDKPQPGQSLETPLPVVLTRYAAQNLYAPLRTVEPARGISRVNLRRDKDFDAALNTLLPTLPVRAKALAAWRLTDQWVTAVRLTSTSPQSVTLDPRALQGDFVAATFQHADLGPAGTPSDTTVVYLVTRGHGLMESLLPAMSPIDASLNLPEPAAQPARVRQGAGHAK